MTIKKINPKIFIYIILTITLAYSIKAFGVSTPYYENNPLNIEPGETKTFQLTLQNFVGNEDVVAQAEVSRGADIARIIDESTEYSVPLGKDNIKTNIEVTIPQDTKIGQKYEIEVSYKTIENQEPGKPITLGTGIKVIIPVEVKITPKSDLSGAAVSGKLTDQLKYIPVILILLILVIVFLLTKRKKKR